MAAWTNDELDKIGKAEELQIATLRADGTLRSPVTIWAVRLGNDLYVRSVNGRRSGSWFMGALTRYAGHIRAGGVSKDATFEEEDSPETNAQIDEAYRTKYRRYPANIVNSILTPQAREATLKLTPR